jgi:hypothetical protein
MDCCMYNIKRVESSRTHEKTIDIEVFDGASKVRAFISKELAMELIHKMLTALTVPFKGEEETIVK